MYISYELYRTTQAKTARQQREDDIRAGELAADFGRLWHSLAHPRAGGQRRSRAMTGTGEVRTPCRPSTGAHAICG
jgi:hypothetical protein